MISDWSGGNAPFCAARAAFFHEIACETGTTIFYEKSPALFAALTELCRVCGVSRPAVLACDLTKPTERIQRGSLEELRRLCKAAQPKGEIILVLSPLFK